MMTSATRETFIPTTYYILLVFFFGASQNDSAAGSEIGYVSRTFEKRIIYGRMSSRRNSHIVI